MASRLTEIYRSEKSTGGGLGSAVGKRLKEKIDPRKMLDQKGLLVSMFPSLKAYNATPRRQTAPKISGGVDSGVDNEALSSIAATSSLTAKNTMSLPMMARDMNLMKLNIFKLVKLQGGSANINKTDIFWSNAKARESAYESSLGKMAAGRMIGGMAKSSLTGRQKRDGQSPDSALFVTGGTGGGVQASEVAEGILTAGVLKKIMTSTVGFMTSSVGLSILGVAAGGVAIAGLARKLQDEQIDKAAERGDVKEVKQQLKNQALGPEGDLYLSPEDSVSMDKALNEISEDRVNKVKKPTKLEIEAQAASERLKNLPDTGAGGGRGFVNPNMPTGAGGGRGSVNPTLVTPEAETIPSNVVRTASGEAVRSGSGGYVTSGTPSVAPTLAPTAPTPAPAAPTPAPVTTTTQKTSPTKQTTATIGNAPGLPIDYKSYATKIGEKESGGKYDAVNSIGYVGKYQFGAMALEDMGLVKKGVGKKGQKALDVSDNWNITGGKQAFLNNAQLQEDTMKRYTMQNYKTLNRLGVVNKNSSPEEVAGYLASSHLLGPGGALNLSKGKSGSDAYGTSAASYYKVGVSTQMPTTAVASAPAVAPSKPSTGTAVASASTSVADGKMAAMAPTSGNTVINNKPTTVASASPSSGGKPGSTYDNELFQTLVGYQSLTA